MTDSQTSNYNKNKKILKNKSEVFNLDESLMRKLINLELLDNYDASTGFDLENLEDFVPKLTKQEIQALKDDPDVNVYEKTIPGADGATDIKLRIYEPAKKEEGLLPCGLFFHGGGFLFGSVYRQNDMCLRFVKNIKMIVVSVEYRLAPKYKSPAPIEDAYTALLWLDKNGESIGADRKRIAIMGLSAGGCITAALALMARDRKGPKPVIQIPMYAMLDYRADTVSQKAITSRKVWCYDYSKISWAHYLDKTPDCYDSPSLAQDLSHLPPLFSFIGTLDPFYDENIEYWTRLMRAGVDVEYHIFPGCYHSFEIAVPESHYAKTAYGLIYSALKRAFKIDI